MLKRNIILFLFASFFYSCFVKDVIRTVVWLPKSKPVEKEYLDTIPFKMENGWVIVEATIGGKKGKYILDTGAPSILDYYDLNRKGIKTRPNDIDTNRWEFDRLMKAYNHNLVKELVLNNTSFKKVGAKTIKFELFDIFFSCEKIKGIIGANVMKDGVWSVKYETNEIIIANDISKLNIDKTYSFKMYPYGKLDYPVVEMSLGDTVFRALIDLGNSSYSIGMPNKKINKEATKKEELLITKPNTLMFSPLAPDKLEPAKIILSELITNSFSKPFVFYAAEELRIGYKELKGIDIILGYDFLKNFNITFDWPNEMVYFEPIEKEFKSKREFKRSNFGINFFNYDKKVYVTTVLPKYCDTTMISVADTVMAINNISIKEIVGDDYCKFIKGEKSLIPKSGEPVFITVKNKNGKVSIVEQKEVILFE